MQPEPDILESRRLNQDLAALLSKALGQATGKRQLFAAGQVVIPSGERPRFLPIIESGTLEAVVLLDDEGHRIVPVSFGRGELAMASVLFSDRPTNVDLVAASPTVVRWLPRPGIEAAVAAEARLMLALVHFLAQRLREVQLREKTWMQRSVRQRICAALARASVEAPPRAAGTTWRISATHEQLAERAGVSRPKVSRELKALEKAGVVRLHRRAVEILDPAALTGMVSDRQAVCHPRD